MHPLVRLAMRWFPAVTVPYPAGDGVRMFLFEDPPRPGTVQRRVELSDGRVLVLHPLGRRWGTGWRRYFQCLRTPYPVAVAPLRADLLARLIWRLL